jgi:hypothetical protein
MNSTQENAIRFNLESARDRSRQEAEQLRLMLRELVLLWEQGSIAARVKKAAAVKAKFETARKLIDECPIESAYADYLIRGGISGAAMLAKLKRKGAARPNIRKDAEKLLKRLR